MHALGTKPFRLLFKNEGSTSRDDNISHMHTR